MRSALLCNTCEVSAASSRRKQASYLHDDHGQREEDQHSQLIDHKGGEHMKPCGTQRQDASEQGPDSSQL